MTTTPSSSTNPRPWAAIEGAGNFVASADPLPRVFLLLLGYTADELPGTLDSSSFVDYWHQRGGTSIPSGSATRCSALAYPGGVPVRLVYTCQAGNRIAGTLAPIADLPVIRCVFDRTQGQNALIAASTWDNSLVALCLEDGLRQAALPVNSRSDIPLRDMKNPVMFYSPYCTMPGVAAHLLVGTASPITVALALGAAVGVLGRRIDSVRFEMIEGVTRARKAARFGASNRSHKANS